MEEFTARQVAAGAVAAPETLAAPDAGGHVDADGFTDQQWHAVSQHMLARYVCSSCVARAAAGDTKSNRQA